MHIWIQFMPCFIFTFFSLHVKHVGMQLFYAMCCTFVCLHFSSSLAICASLFCFYFCSNFNFKTLNSQLAQFTSLAQWSKLHFICQFLLDNWHKHLHHTHNAHKYLFLYHVNYKTEIENENHVFVCGDASTKHGEVLCIYLFTDILCRIALRDFHVPWYDRSVPLKHTHKYNTSLVTCMLAYSPSSSSSTS